MCQHFKQLQFAMGIPVGGQQAVQNLTILIPQ
jgi:hypothetical protein